MTGVPNRSTGVRCHHAAGESRVARHRPEGQVGDLRGEVQTNKLDVTATQALVVAVDRDVSQMSGFRQATIATINVLRQDMVDMRQVIVDMQQDMTNGFSEMRDKFDTTTAGQQRIVELIQNAIAVQGGSAPA